MTTPPLSDEQETDNTVQQILKNFATDCECPENKYFVCDSCINRSLIGIGIEEGRKIEKAAHQKRVEGLVENTWHKGCPPHPYDKEWFIAKTTFGDKVVLIALPEEFTYDFKTADDTYLMKDTIKCWMQFPDSEYKTYERGRE